MKFYLTDFSSGVVIQLFIIVFFALQRSSEALFEGCDNNYNINAGYTYLKSPYYPNYYPSGSSCRYKFTAPLDYDIQINCTIDLQKSGSTCSSEYFYVATDGDTQLRGSEQFCGQGGITRRSLFRSVALAYVSTSGSDGRFECYIYAAPQNCDCGWSVNTRIVNGQEANINEYPSMVALHDTATNVPVFCGGVILSHRYIATAAHCTQMQSTASNIIAYVGDHDISSGSESRYAGAYSIMQIIEHPSYTSNPVNNDIALLITSQNIEWSRGVGPICLPPSSEATNSFAYDYVDVVGWGTTSFGGPTSNSLQKVTLQVVANSACANSYQGTAPIYTSQLCTYDYTGNSRDSCQYDSGGPAIIHTARQFLIGIVSFGKICGQGGYSMGVNTRVTSFLNWIYQYVPVCNRAM